MHTADLINGLFEFAGALATGINSWTLFKQKHVHAFHPYVYAYFTAWALYNLYYYPHLAQWMSFTGGCCILVSNALYTCLCIHYHRLGKARKREQSIKDGKGLSSPDAEGKEGYSRSRTHTAPPYRQSLRYSSDYTGD